ncbi:MAG TPA: Rieske (2Fe-2S) protein, partial [Candidatus Binatia bacterium]|nr:Rieske (2Fe-2S) protein [Candidatus Binatia bacterium]
MTTSLNQLIDSYDSNALLSEASTPPSSWYSDPRILELEQQTVFSRSWQLVARAEQLREPGQYVTSEVAGEPILLLVGHDGVVRGFYNVCRHHAAAVVSEPQGRAEHLRCPYHGWTYNLEGALVVAPEFGGVRNFDKSANGLVPVETAIWQGWIFVKLISNDTPLEAYLGKDLAEGVQGLKLEQLSWFDRRWYSVKCNW